MKHWKMGIFATMLATVAVSVGAASASAANTALCANLEPVCFAPLASGTVIKGATGPTPEAAFLSTNLVNVECMSSLEMHLTRSTNNPLFAEITSLTWSECHVAGNPMQPCTVSSVHLNYTAAFSRTAENEGTFTVAIGATGKPGMTVACGALISCELVKENAVLEADGGNAGTAFAKAKAISLETAGGVKCPTKATWTAKYVFSAPAVAFISE